MRLLGEIIGGTILIAAIYAGLVNGGRVFVCGLAKRKKAKQTFEKKETTD